MSSSAKPANNSNTTNTSNNGNNGLIQTYNMMGGGLEGFAVPVGLLRMGDAFQLGGSSQNDFAKLRVPDVVDVSAIPHDLYEKLLKLSQYDISTDGSPKKRNKTKKNTLSTSSRKSKKSKGKE